MRAKVEDAMTSLALTRGRSKVREAYLTRRWGHHVGVMSAFKVICQEQVEEAWKEKGDKCTSKLQHLEMKWKREERHRTQKLDIGGEWRGVKIGDRELEEEEERRDRGERRTRPVLKYGTVVTSAEEDSLLSLPAKFSTYQAITLEKVEVALQVSMAKARWELQSRKERGEGEAEEEQEWSEDWELDIKTLCLSTEEMIVGMEMVNTKKEEIHKLVVMSMDVEKMYPMMKASKVAQVVADEYRKSSFKVEVDPRALSLYLAIMIGREELVERGLGEVTHTKKRGEGGRGRKIGITTAEVTQETVPEDKKLFFPPARKPTAPLQVVWQENDQPLADDEQLCPIRQSEEELSGADGLDETVQHQENLALESECRYLDRLLPQDEMVRLQRNLPR